MTNKRPQPEEIITKLRQVEVLMGQGMARLDAIRRCCQTNENSHQIAGAALIYALNSWRHSARAAVRLSLKLSRE